MVKRLGLRIIYYLVAISLLTFIINIFLSLPDKNPTWLLNTYTLLCIVALNYFFFLIERKIFYPMQGVEENKKLKKIKLTPQLYLILGTLLLFSIGFYISFIIKNSLTSLIIFLLVIVTFLAIVSIKITPMINFAFQTRFFAATNEKTYSTNLIVLDSMKADLHEYNTAIKEELEKNGYNLMLRKDFVRMLKGIKFSENLSDEKVYDLHKIYDETVLNKSKIEKAKGYTIKFRNQYNLYSHIIFAILIFLIVVKLRNCEYKILDFLLFDRLYLNETIINIVVIFLLLEIIQRGVEISIAFYLDIKESQPKTSNLSNSDRLMLAIKSMIEISLISLSIRLLILDFENVESIFNTILQSFSVGLFNVSYSDKAVENIDGLQQLIISFTHFSQVIISVLLLTMAIAKYLSNDKNNYDFCIKCNPSFYSSRYGVEKLIKSPYQENYTFIVHGNTFQELEERCGELLRENKLTIDEYNSIQTYLYRYCYKEEKKKIKRRI